MRRPLPQIEPEIPGADRFLAGVARQTHPRAGFQRFFSDLSAGSSEPGSYLNVVGTDGGARIEYYTIQLPWLLPVASVPREIRAPARPGVELSERNSL